MNLHKPTTRNFRSDEEAVRKLSPEQFRVTQTNGTERPGTGEYLHNEEPGIHVDVVSGELLFASSQKFDSGSGWPSFTRPIDSANGNEVRNPTHAMAGTEVRSTHGDSRPCVFGRAAGQRRIALLHQLGGASVHPSRRHGGRGLWRLPEPGGGPRMTDERPPFPPRIVHRRNRIARQPSL